jgi:hypothetical protein
MLQTPNATPLSSMLEMGSKSFSFQIKFLLIKSFLFRDYAPSRQGVSCWFP